MTNQAAEKLPYRLALAGGWIDQPFISRLNPNPPGSMVVISTQPTIQFMVRSGMATGTRKVAAGLWNGRLPNRPPAQLVKELYEQENKNQIDPSGSQDMIGLLYPGVSRLDYDFVHEGGIFPKHIANNCDPEIAAWIQRVIHIIPVAPRPQGYSPLGEKNLDPKRIADLGQTGKDCFDAIVARDVKALGDSMNRCMKCWEALLPQVVRHPLIKINLMKLLAEYQSNYDGAMYSGCGGGYLYVVSNEPIDGALKIKVRLA